MTEEEKSRNLLTVPDVVSLFKISRRTVYYWVKRGILVPVRIGGVLRFHPEDVERLIDENRRSKPAQKKRILAIDDDPLVRLSLEHVLERAGYEARVVDSGAAALELLSKEPVDLIITDIRMPGMNGIDTLKAIRKNRKQLGQSRVPEIILTAYEDSTVRAEAGRLGVEEFVLKPVELNDFLSVIERNLN